MLFNKVRVKPFVMGAHIQTEDRQIHGQSHKTALRKVQIQICITDRQQTDKQTNKTIRSMKNSNLDWFLVKWLQGEQALLVGSLIRHECVIGDSELITNTFHPHSNAVVFFSSLWSTFKVVNDLLGLAVSGDTGNPQQLRIQVQSLVVGTRDIWSCCNQEAVSLWEPKVALTFKAKSQWPIHFI